MAKKDSVIKKIPKGETVRLTYINDKGKTYIVTVDRDRKYYLYEKLDKEYKYLKSRSNDPLFKECYEQ